MGSSSAQTNGYDLSFKVLLIGDSGVGKSSLLMSFTSPDSTTELPPTIGVDFEIKHVTVGGKRIKLTIWDTAGQERFRTLPSSYYRNAQGILLVYDVTRRETFENISDMWAKELEIYSTYPDCQKCSSVTRSTSRSTIQESRRLVTKDEGAALAKVLGCLFIECSAKTRENVEQCFESVVSKIMEFPSLVEEGSNAINKRNILERPGEESSRPPPPSPSGCC